MNAQKMAHEYRRTFGTSLYGRLRIISHRYPDVQHPDFISWEGEKLTGADTTFKVRKLLSKLSWAD